MGYQLVVFEDGKFAGTLLAGPMDPRTDGDTCGRIVAGKGLEVEFFRCGPEDAMCCPSRMSHVSYEVRREADCPVVVPTGSTTKPLS
jgi:hypothetical protein